MENVAIIIRTARAVAGVSQGNLAKRAGIGQNRLSEMERGKRRPNPEVAHRLWDALLFSDRKGEAIAA